MINKTVNNYKKLIKQLQRKNQIRYDIIKKLVISLQMCEEQLNPGLLRNDINQTIKMLKYYV